MIELIPDIELKFNQIVLCAHPAAISRRRWRRGVLGHEVGRVRPSASEICLSGDSDAI
jgi:hypothetical protein